MEQVTEGLRAGGWPHPIEADHRSLQLNLGERLGFVDLEPFLRRWVKAPRSERDAAVREAIGFVAELDADQGFEATRDLLVPAVRSMEFALAELYGAEAQSDQNWRPLTQPLTDQPSSTIRHTISARPRRVGRAFSCTFIQEVPVEVECRNPSFVQTSPWVNNLHSFDS